MKSYLDTIKEHAASRNVEVKEAFRVADLPTSTYYRTINNTTELRYETALKIFNAVDEKLKRDKHRERNKSVNINRKRVYRYWNDILFTALHADKKHTNLLQYLKMIRKDQQNYVIFIALNVMKESYAKQK